MIHRLFIFIFLLLLWQPVEAQKRFSANPTTRLLQRNTSFGTLHDFIQLKNHTGDTLQMRWRLYYRGGDSLWKVNLQDPEHFYADVLMVDSADFILPDSANNYTRNKIIIGVAHQQATGFANYRFTIFEKGRRKDSLQINFQVTVVSGMQIEESTAAATLKVFPQPARDILFIEGASHISPHSIRVLNAKGQEIAINSHTWNEGFLDISAWPGGVYYLCWSEEGINRVQKLVVKRAN